MMSLFEIRNLKKMYGENIAVDDVSFSVNLGEIVALIGKNGAGKTTILNSIVRNIFPTSGEIVYKGETLLTDNSLLNEFGILIQANFLDYLNAFDNLYLLGSFLHKGSSAELKNEIEDLLALVGLERQKKAYVKTFSFGMKQRLGLAQAFLNHPCFLVLDEPFVGLDPTGKTMLKETILGYAKKNNVGVLFSSHDLEDVEEISDRIVMIDNGKKIYDDMFKKNKHYIACYEGNEEHVPDAESLQRLLVQLSGQGHVVSDVITAEESLYDLFDVHKGGDKT